MSLGVDEISVNEEDGYLGLGSPGSSVSFRNQPVVPGSGVSISVHPSIYKSPREFRNSFSSFGNSFVHGSKKTILGEGFGVYSIGGNDTYYLVYTDYSVPSNPSKGMALFSRIGDQDMGIFFSGPTTQSFDQQMPAVQKMIDSIKITPSNPTNNTSAQYSTPPQLPSSTPPQLRILGTNSFYDNNQYNPGLHTVGEVLNYGTEKATFVSVSATLYDANNQVVGIGHTYTTPSNIMPGKKAPFEIVVYRDNIKGGDFRSVHHFSLQLG